jgi:O-methyltransferase involved in polyketide biosynthesis/nucleoside-diphosphate-sugar epimerase
MKTSELEHLQSAMITAWVRSIESSKKDRLFNDPFAEYLSNRPNLEFLSVRTKLFDQELVKAVSMLNTDCQIVILGAGMDTRALRLEELSHIPVFEIDLPLVVNTKNKLMKQHQISRGNYAQIEANLEDTEWPQLLKNAGFQYSVPTIWLAEGLLTYLENNKAIELFKKMYAISATSSVVLADIPDQSAAGKNNRIRFTCDNPNVWFGKSNWASTDTILPESNADLQRQYESVNQQISLFRAIKKKTVLIIGCGYFGTQLLETFCTSKQYEVIATTTTAKRTNKLIEQGATETVVWDGTKANDIKSLIGKVDIVVVSLRSPTHDNETILTTLKQISTVLHPSQHLIQISSIEVYPGNIHEAKEEDYSTQKIQYAMENVFAEHKSKCILRIGQLYGAGTDPHGFSRNMKGHLEKIMAITTGVLPGDGTQPVCLTHVQDLVSFTEFVIDKNLKGTFNICNTLNFDRKIFYETLCDYYKVKPLIWSQNTESIKHMLLPKVINTYRLQQLPFSLDESHYKIESILKE